MEWRRISSGSSGNLSWEVWEYLGEYVHFLTASGPVGRAERLPVTQEALTMNKTGNYFTLFDNSRDHLSAHSYDDLLYFADMLKEAGIKRFFNAVVTNDPSYPAAAKLMIAVGEMKQLKIEVYHSSEYNEALDFIKRKVAGVSEKK